MFRFVVGGIGNGAGAAAILSDLGFRVAKTLGE